MWKGTLSGLVAITEALQSISPRMVDPKTGLSEAACRGTYISTFFERDQNGKVVRMVHYHGSASAPLRRSMTHASSAHKFEHGVTDVNHASIGRELRKLEFNLERTSVWHRYIYLTAESDWASNEGLLKQARMVLGGSILLDIDFTRLFLASARVNTECMSRGGLPETTDCTVAAAPLEQRVAAACTSLRDLAVQGNPVALLMEQGRIWCGLTSLNVLTMTHLQETNLVSRATSVALFGIGWSDQDFERLLDRKGPSARQGAAVRLQVKQFITRTKHYGLTVRGMARWLVR